MGYATKDDQCKRVEWYQRIQDAAPSYFSSKSNQNSVIRSSSLLICMGLELAFCSYSLLAHLSSHRQLEAKKQVIMP